MAKRKDSGDKPDDGGKKEPYPSRKNTRYVAIPLAMYEALQRYAESRSDEDDTKSTSWAARVAIRRLLTEAGMWPPPTSSGGK